MAGAAHPLRIFLCHSSGDKQAVRDLYGRLCTDGFDPWLDVEKLLPGQDWELEIRKAVKKSDIIIVCLSEEAINKRGFVQKEIKYALDVALEQPEDTIFIIPVKLEECKVPESLSRWHWVSLLDSDGYARLLSVLKWRAQAISISHGINNSQPASEATTGHGSIHRQARPEREGESGAAEPASNRLEIDRTSLTKFIFEQVSNYPSNFAATLRRPDLRFPPIRIATLKEPSYLTTLTSGSGIVISSRLNPQLLVFALISIFIGTTLSGLTPGKKAGPHLAVMVVLAVCVWILYSCFVHLICKIFKGRGSLLETVSIGIQLFAVVYVVSSLTALLWGVAITLNKAPAPLTETLSISISPAVASPPLTQPVQIIPFYKLPPFWNYHLLLEYPFFLYFVTQFLLLIIYVPLAVKHLHHFKGKRLMIIALILIIILPPFIQYNTLFYAVIGSPVGVPVPIPQPEPTSTPFPTPSPIDESNIVGEWRAKTDLRDELTGERFRELEFYFDEDGYVSSTGSDFTARAPRHRVIGRYNVLDKSIHIVFDGCQHFRPSSSYQLHLEQGQLKWEPPHFHGSRETLYFEPFKGERTRGIQ